MYKVIFVILLNITSFSVKAQTVITGKVADFSTNTPLPGCQVYLKCLTSKTEQFWEGVSNQYGDFSIKVYIELPQTFEIIIKVNGHNHSEKRVISANSGAIIIKPYDEFTRVKNKVEIVSQRIDYSLEQLKTVKKVSKTNSKNSNTDDKATNILNDEVIKLQNDVTSFKQKLDNKELELDEAKLEITKLENKITEINNRISEIMKYVADLETKVHNAYMRLVDCFCEDYQNNSITIGFKVVDENKNIISSGMEPFRVEVLRLRSVNNNSNGEQEPLKNSESGYTHFDKDVFFSTNRIYLTFKTKESEFKNLSNNYSVNVYNRKFDIPIKRIDINSLKRECFKRNLKDLSSELNNRIVSVKKQIEVKSKRLRFTITDKGQIDGDRGILYLNGKVIYPEFEITNTERKIVFELDLDEDENVLVLHAVNLGRIPPNTINVTINDGTFEYESLTMESNLENSEGVKIVYKK